MPTDVTFTRFFVAPPDPRVYRTSQHRLDDIFAITHMLPLSLKPRFAFPIDRAGHGGTVISGLARRVRGRIPGSRRGEGLHSTEPPVVASLRPECPATKSRQRTRATYDEYLRETVPHDATCDPRVALRHLGGLRSGTVFGPARSSTARRTLRPSREGACFPFRLYAGPVRVHLAHGRSRSLACWP